MQCDCEATSSDLKSCHTISKAPFPEIQLLDDEIMLEAPTRKTFIETTRNLFVLRQFTAAGDNLQSLVCFIKKEKIRRSLQPRCELHQQTVNWLFSPYLCCFAKCRQKKKEAKKSVRTRSVNAFVELIRWKRKKKWFIFINFLDNFFFVSFSFPPFSVGLLCFSHPHSAAAYRWKDLKFLTSQRNSIEVECVSRMYISRSNGIRRSAITSPPPLPEINSSKRFVMFYDVRLKIRPIRRGTKDFFLIISNPNFYGMLLPRTGERERGKKGRWENARL